jgi:threonylcarbamoyladenosine tRNA methylthiotransferase CDKAL1
MEDLEDLTAGLRTSRLDDEAEASGVTSVLPKSGRPAKRSTDDEAASVPGTQTVYLKTQGCSHNVSDSEYMAGLLSCYGYRITEVFEEADV